MDCKAEIFELHAVLIQALTSLRIVWNPARLCHPFLAGSRFTNIRGIIDFSQQCPEKIYFTTFLIDNKNLM